MHYDLIVIGGGAAGLTSAGMATNFGMKTLMVEADRLGGDCTWYGCIPSKALLHLASLKKAADQSLFFTDQEKASKVDFKKVIQRVHELREHVYQEADRPDIYEKMGVDLAFGRARFLDDHTIEISSETETKIFSSKYFVIATGSKAVIPNLVGIETVPYLTNHTLFELNTLPDHLLILGGGPIGCEMAQAFSRFGSKVTILEAQDRLLTRDDPKVARILEEQLRSEGIQIVLNAQVQHFSKDQDHIVCDWTTSEGSESLRVSHLLIAAGRRPNIESLCLDKAGLHFTKTGVTVNERCQTNRKHIYAAGDVTGKANFTHMAEHMAKTAITNIALKIPKKMDSNSLSWVTYTDPEVASLGMSEAELLQKGVSFQVYEFPYTKVDRALSTGNTSGLIRVFARPWDGKIFGAAIAGDRAGELIGELGLALKNGISLRKIADTIHAYPSYALAVRRAADQWYVRKQSRGFVKALKFLFRFRGPLPDVSDPHRIV
jgi:pyruvate/2-oxoglutarate dehydrogenase complex dihydrolipoamide dehydrogenase (E3) component